MKGVRLLRSLQGQHLWHEIETTRAAERGQIGAETESGTTSQGLTRYQRCSARPRLTLDSRNHLDKTHQQASQQFISRPLLH